MNAQDLRELLEQSYDRLSILSSSETLAKYTITKKDFLNLISDFLSDEEKVRLLNSMQLNTGVRASIIGLFSDENMALQVLNNDTIMEGLNNNQITDIVLKMNDSLKKQLLYNQDFIEKYQINNRDLSRIVFSLSDSVKVEILHDTDLITNQLHLKDYKIAELIKELSDEDVKKTMVEKYELPGFLIIDILDTLNNDSRIDLLLKKDNLKKSDRIKILQSLDIETLSNFLKQHKDFCSEKDIHPYKIISKLDAEQQKEFITKLEDTDLTLSEKREILATLKEEVKQSIDTKNFPEEYKTALSIQTTKNDEIASIDFERSLEDYRGLDRLMRINPENFTEEQRAIFMKLCDICPDLKVVNTTRDSVEFTSTASEYKEAEEWISSIIEKLKPEYSQAQKIAIIDYEIGKKISYSPDFETEVSNSLNCRALWRIISSGYGVCNGIAKVENYILNRIGIESEIVNSNNHAFLKIKDIELPLANGKTVRGNTILDPTWNLANHRFGSKPNNFCISYEQARKNDIDDDGKDHNCHKNDEQLQDATISLDEQSLRELFKSLGLADKDGNFPILKMKEISKHLDELYSNQPEMNISKQFLLLKKICPEFATCQNSSMSILSGVLLNNENLKFNRCVVNRVYDRSDNKKRPIIFVYIDSNELGQKFYYANKDGDFIELPKEEFIEKFECYEEDLKKYKRY